MKALLIAVLATIGSSQGIESSIPWDFDDSKQLSQQEGEVCTGRTDGTHFVRRDGSAYLGGRYDWRCGPGLGCDIAFKHCHHGNYEFKIENPSTTPCGKQRYESSPSNNGYPPKLKPYVPGNYIYTGVCRKYKVVKDRKLGQLCLISKPASKLRGESPRDRYECAEGLVCKPATISRCQTKGMPDKPLNAYISSARMLEPLVGWEERDFDQCESSVDPNCEGKCTVDPHWATHYGDQFGACVRPHHNAPKRN